MATVEPRWTAAVLGAGPHGQELARQLKKNGWTVALFDDAMPDHEPVKVGAERHKKFFIGAAWPKVRRQIAENVQPFTSYGSFVCQSATASSDTECGAHVFVGANAVVSHGCSVGSFVQICAGACLGGEVTVEDDVFIGMNATIIHGGITLGHGSVIGAGAVVLRNVPPNTTVAGNPARIL